MTEHLQERRETLCTDMNGKEKPQIPVEIRNALKEPTFNVWELQEEEMLTLLEHMLYDLELVTRFKIEATTLQKFLSCLQNHYRMNPFHNFRHAFCVTQMMYSVLSLCNLQSCLSSVDMVTLIVGSLCHDLDHPGLNNTYQVNARTELARRYQNKSPLENHHCAIAMQILRHPQSNIFSRTDPEEAREILEGIAELILATDMIHHSSVLQSLRGLQCFSSANKGHVTLVKKALIKLCDISNKARPAAQAEIWADALMEEYFQQSDREKAEGLPVTPFMDRDTVIKSESQISFISFLLLPLCDSLCEIFPPMSPLLLEPLREAKLRYEGQMGQARGQKL